MPASIVVLRLSSMGDILLTVATITNLRLAYPDHEIIFVTREKFAEPASLLPVDLLIAIPEPVSFLSLWNASQQLSAFNVSLLIDLHANTRTMLLKSWVAAKQTLTYPKRRFERTQMVKRGAEEDLPLSVLDQYSQPLFELRIPIHAKHANLSLAHVHHLRGKRLSRIVIAPGAAHHTKRWPLQSFVEIAHLMKKQTGCEVLWAVSRADEALLEPQRSKIAGDTVVAGEPIATLAGHIAESMLTIANDSGIMHLSSAVRTPTLGLFGPTHPALGFAPTGLFDEIAQRSLFCRPCSLHGKRRCWREEQYCFSELSPQSVFSQAVRMYDEQRKRRPVLILDRDGTIIENRHYNANPDDIVFLPGALELIKEAKSAGIAVLIVSNQSGVAREFFSIKEAERMNHSLINKIRENGVSVDASQFCPHHPTAGPPSEFRRVCNCRKPSAGMIYDVAQSLSLDLGRTVVLGDSLDDLGLGLVLGGKSVLVRTGHGMKSEEQLRKQRPRADIVVVDNLVDAQKAIGL